MGEQPQVSHGYGGSPFARLDFFKRGLASIVALRSPFGQPATSTDVIADENVCKALAVEVQALEEDISRWTLCIICPRSITFILIYVKLTYFSTGVILTL